MSQSLSIRIYYTMLRLDGTYYSDGFSNASGNDENVNCLQQSFNVNFNYRFDRCTFGSSTPSSRIGDCILVGLSGWVGAAFIPVSSRQGDTVQGNFFCDFTQPCYELRVLDSGDSFNGFSQNGLYYKDNDGNWHESSSGNIVATASQVSNLPSNVEFNGWLVDNTIISGSDGKYYDTEGNELFQNLPSGVIPSYSGIDGIFSGSDGYFYDVDGDQILQNLPVDVTPISGYGDIIKGSDGSYYDLGGDQVLQNLPNGVDIVSNVGNLYKGSDGKYYDILGVERMSNLPSGVDIISFDNDTGLYEGSDGNHYDIDGNEDSSESCQGDLIGYSPNLRITFDGVDILGNRITISADISVNTTSILLTNYFPGFNFLKKIDRIIVRNLDDFFSVGEYRLKIYGVVCGFRVGFDVETLDPDFVLGRYNVCTCIFHTCSKYAEVVLNSDLPLGVTPNTSSLDVGYYVLNSELYFDFEKVSDVEFPYCCSTYDGSEKHSGSTNDNNSSSYDDIVEKLDDINESLKDLIDTIKDLDLTPHVDVTISPNDLVNIRKVFYHGFDDE